jgi:hypothetical protein
LSSYAEMRIANGDQDGHCEASHLSVSELSTPSTFLKDLVQ